MSSFQSRDLCYWDLVRKVGEFNGDWRRLSDTHEWPSEKDKAVNEFCVIRSKVMSTSLITCPINIMKFWRRSQK